MPHADPIARRRYHKAYFQSHKKEARNRARIKYHRDPAVRQARLSYLSTWKRNKRRFDRGVARARESPGASSVREG